MKTPQQVLDQSREEFEKRFPSQEILEGNKRVFRFEYQIDANEISFFLTTTLKAFIEAEVEMLEGMKKDKFPPESYSDDIENTQADGYNQALNDCIAHLKGLLHN